eukprot:1128345-Pyramimonas_sp.AAC.1
MSPGVRKPGRHRHKRHLRYLNLGTAGRRGWRSCAPRGLRLSGFTSGQYPVGFTPRSFASSSLLRWL